MRKVAFEIRDNSIQASSSYAGPSVFHFRIHFNRQAPTSEVHAPLREILDPPLHIVPFAA